MKRALWIAAGLLAAVAVISGSSKLFVPKEKLAAAPGGSWTGDASTAFVKSLGGVELLAAAGLTLPGALGIAPVLVPVTAVCWIMLMVGATITHARRSESAFMALTLSYLALAAFIAWGRFGHWAFADTRAAKHRAGFRQAALRRGGRAGGARPRLARGPLALLSPAHDRPLQGEVSAVLH